MDTDEGATLLQKARSAASSRATCFETIKIPPERYAAIMHVEKIGEAREQIDRDRPRQHHQG